MTSSAIRLPEAFAHPPDDSSSPERTWQSQRDFSLPICAFANEFSIHFPSHWPQNHATIGRPIAEVYLMSHHPPEIDRRVSADAPRHYPPVAGGWLL